MGSTSCQAALGQKISNGGTFLLHHSVFDSKLFFKSDSTTGYEARIIKSLVTIQHGSLVMSTVLIERFATIKKDWTYSGWPISWRTSVGLTLILAVPPSAWADGNLAELAEQLGKMVEHPKSKSTQPRFARRWVTLSLCRHSSSYYICPFQESFWGHIGRFFVWFIKSIELPPCSVEESVARRRHRDPDCHHCRRGGLWAVRFRHQQGEADHLLKFLVPSI